MKSENRQKIYVITGCTAVGKTDFSLDFALQNNAEIVSCDSLLVYKNMDIGTAKPMKNELQLVKHHCIDVVEPNEKFDVSMYVDCAKKAVDSIIKSGKNVVVVGGSGFYLKSFYYPVIDDVKISKDVENFVKELFKSSGLDGVVSALVSANNGVCPAVDIKNPRRVVSSLKRCLESKKTFDDVKKEFDSLESEFAGYEKYTILLERNKDVLKLRVIQRVKKMVKDGLIDEVKFLLSKYDCLCESAASSIGYRETINWLKNPTSMDLLVDEISQNTIKLIKKQRTWLKTQIPITEKILLL